MTIPTITTVDTCGLSCPQPVLMVLENITKNAPNAPNALDVLGDSDASRENVTRAAGNRGYNVELATEPQQGRQGVWLLRLRK